MANIKSDFQFIDHKINKLAIENELSELTGTIYYDLSIEVKNTPAIEEDENGNYIGLVNLTLDVSGRSPNQDDKCIKIKLELEGGFTAPGNNVVLEDFNEMLDINGVATLYSVARSVIVSISAQCCTNGQVRIPMLNMIEVRKAIDEAEEAESRPKPSSTSSPENE